MAYLNAGVIVFEPSDADVLLAYYRNVKRAQQATAKATSRK